MQNPMEKKLESEIETRKYTGDIQGLCRDYLWFRRVI